MTVDTVPTVTNADQLAQVESVPLRERGLAWTTYELVRAAARRDPEGIASVWIPDLTREREECTVTFAELLHGVHRVANVLTQLGVGRGDAVTLSSANVSSLLIATLGAQAVGIAAPLNPGLSADQTLDLMRATGSRVVVAAGPELDPQSWGRLVDLGGDLGVRAMLALRPDDAVGDPPELERRPGVTVAYLDELCATTGSEPVGWEPPTRDDVAAYFHTGGTTGAPKVAAHTHANEAFAAWDIAVCSTLGAGERVIAGLPLFHVNALLVTALSPLVNGACAVWPSPLGYRDPLLYGCLWRLIERHRARAMSAVPTVYAQLLRCPVDADISSLSTPAVGAAPLPESVRAAFGDHTGVALCEGYGSTEATCATSATPPGAAIAGSVGQRMPYQKVKAVRVDDDGQWHDLPRGQFGELAIAGPTVFAGYLVAGPDGPVPSLDGCVEDGWLRTGDLGMVDEQERIFLRGRTKDLIIRGGHNIDPVQIESVLLQHPDVSQAAAVGRPDRHAGEVPVAFVAPRPGLAPEAVDPGALCAWAARRIDEAAARPKSVTVVPTLPVTAVGKPFKPALREQAALDVVREECAATGVDGVEASATHVDGGLVIRVTGAGSRAAAVADSLAGFPFRTEIT